ncbi:MAG: hypothetical protein LBT38_04250 [Deltaproteobacteria bacterium]|jgi:hypothetical protein|nr:hypothetical protein [Deltaproteobacteria bacterium]
MLVTSDFLAFVNRKKVERPSRNPVESAWESSPGDRQRPDQPLESNPTPKSNRGKEVDYLNARQSTLDVVL